MKERAELYRDCHKELGRLYTSRQVPFLDENIVTQLKHDGAINHNGLNAAITTKGDDLYQTRHYLQLAKEEDYRKKEFELKERESLIHQIATEQSMEQTRINKKTLIYQKLTLVFSAIAATCTIVGMIISCQK